MLQSLLARRTGLLATRTVQRTQRYVMYVLFYIGMIFMAGENSFAMHKFLQSDVLFHKTCCLLLILHTPCLCIPLLYFCRKKMGGGTFVGNISCCV